MRTWVWILSTCVKGQCGRLQKASPYCGGGSEDRKTPGACWPVHLHDWWTPWSIRDRVSKKKMEKTQGWYPTSVSRLHIHVQTWTSTPINMYYTHTEKEIINDMCCSFFPFFCLGSYYRFTLSAFITVSFCSSDIMPLVAKNSPYVFMESVFTSCIYQDCVPISVHTLRGFICLPFPLSSYNCCIPWSLCSFLIRIKTLNMWPVISNSMECCTISG